MKIVYKQFYLGKYKAESDDLYLADYYMKKCSQYVLTIPLIKKSDMPHNNNFIRNLMGEDIFELQPTPDYLKDYLQMNMNAIQYSKDIGYKEQEGLSPECKFPGNLQCLFQQ